jgi:membrane protein
MGAALAYYTLFSLAPLLLISISLAGLVFGEDAARGEILGQMAGLVGTDSARLIESMLVALNRPAAGVGGTLFGAATLFIGATTVFAELQDALDRIWRAPPRPAGAGWWGVVRSRLLSFGMVLAVGFLLLVSLIASAALAAFGKWWGGSFTSLTLVAQTVDAALGFAFVTAVFVAIYKWMPRATVAWRDVWIGAVISALLFTLGKGLIALYIGRSGVASIFGAAASVVVMLVWIYYSAQIFLLGAEFTRVYAHRHGSRACTPQAPGSADVT